MAKLALKLRDQKRRKTVEKFKTRRAALLEIIYDVRASDEAKEEARTKGVGCFTKDEAIECFIDLGWRYWRSATRYLDDGQAWFEVLPATARHPLHALHITPGARR